MEIHFFENGGYWELHSLNDEDIEGSFIIDSPGRLIKVTGKEMSGRDIKIQYQYSFRQGELILHVQMPDPDDIFTMEFVRF